VVRTEEEEAEAQLVELLSKGLDFKGAVEEQQEEDQEEDQDQEAGSSNNPMVERVQALAAALVEKLEEADESEKRLNAKGLLSCASQLPVHAPLLGVVVALMTASPSAVPFTQVRCCCCCWKSIIILGVSYLIQQNNTDSQL
jgi:hypothetical protein